MGCARRTSAAAQIGLLDERVLEQLLRGAGEDDFAHLKHVAAMGDRKRHVHILLDHEDGGALLVDGADDVEDLLHQARRSEEHTSELQSQSNLVCRLLLEKKKATVCYARSSNRRGPDPQARGCDVVRHGGSSGTRA